MTRLRVGELITSRLRDKAMESMGFQRVGDFEKDDVFVAGYPKSGNTWLQYLIASLAYGMDGRLSSDTLVQDLVPDVHYKTYYRRYGDPMYFKTHHLPRREYRRVINLIRDGRDVMVSYWHHRRALEGDADFKAMVVSGEGLFPSKWHEHVAAWMENPFGSEILVVKYEDLLTNPMIELERISVFLGLDRDAAVLERVATSNSFAQMSEKETSSGWDERSGWPSDKKFVRRGKAGSYLDEMPPDVLDAFMREAGDVLTSLYVSD